MPVLALSAVVLWGCEAPTSDPVFPASAPFADPASGAVRDSASAEATGTGSLAERLTQRRRRQREVGRSTGAGAARDLGQVQSVSLAGRLRADLPRSPDRWSWAEEGDLGLILHAPGGQAPDALIYAEAFSSLARQGPAAETRRFLSTVVPDLPTADLRTVGEGELPIHSAARGLGISRRTLSRSVEGILTATLGRGLGFGPGGGSFSGWRWLGRNRHGVYLRIGRTEGRWREQPELGPEVRRVLEALAQKAPELEDLLWDAPETRPVPSSPALMLLGSASYGEGWEEGVHLAILCRRAPQCGVREDLVRFLDSLRLPRPGHGGSVARPTGSLAELARLSGLQLQPVEQSRRRELAEALRRSGPHP